MKTRLFVVASWFYAIKCALNHYNIAWVRVTISWLSHNSSPNVWSHIYSAINSSKRLQTSDTQCMHGAFCTVLHNVQHSRASKQYASMFVSDTHYSAAAQSVHPQLNTRTVFIEALNDGLILRHARYVSRWYLTEAVEQVFPWRWDAV